MAVAVIATMVLGLGHGAGGSDRESKVIGMVMCLLGGMEDADNGYCSQALYSCGALNKH